MKKSYLLIMLFIGTIPVCAQQFNLSAELRPRFENRHGYGSLFSKGNHAATFISQRSRMNFNYKSKDFVMRATLQNVSVWGDSMILENSSDWNSFHEIWAKWMVSDMLILKIGRQEIQYDDSRIFGVRDWEQESISHDAVVIKYRPESHMRLDIGLALNSQEESLFKVNYNLDQYKTMQYFWYHSNSGNLGISFLLLNYGLEYDSILSDKRVVSFNQTVGPHITYKLNDFHAVVSGYLQTGKIQAYDVNASYLSVEACYKFSSSFLAELEVQYLSGKNTNDSSTKIKSFMPFFGDNHKFNGLMDYFYAGNPHLGVGLVDYNAKFNYKLGRFNLLFSPHVFRSAAKVYDYNDNRMSDNLGTELDLVLGYKVSKDITVNAGYSQMFATRTMERVKETGVGSRDSNNNWAWVMLTFEPSFFTTRS